MLAHVAGIPVEEALLAAPALLAGVTVIAGYVRATAARTRRSIPLAIPADSMRFMAARAGSTTVEIDASHAVTVSQPGVVADLIDTAARATARGDVAEAVA